MASDICLMTILIVRKETRCRHIIYSFRLTARVLLYAPSHRQDNTYHGLCYTRRGALAGTRNSSMGPPHEGSIRRPIAPWANALPLSYVPLPYLMQGRIPFVPLTFQHWFFRHFGHIFIFCVTTLVYQTTEDCAESGASEEISHRCICLLVAFHGNKETGAEITFLVI